MKEFLNKLKSRKFLSCAAGVLMGICMVFGLDADAIDTISGAVVAVGSIIAYIYSEGKIDAEAVDKIKDAADIVKDTIDVVDKIEE